MLPTTETIKERLEFFRTNPNAIQRYSLELLEEISKENYTISDPSNPFIFLLEVAASMASDSMNESKSRVRELYPALASKPEDIYRHMSDVDYLNQFSIPGKITMSLIFNVHDIFDLAIEVPDQNFRKITIPKDTIFSISEYNFGIYYPIDLRVTLHGEIQIVYDTSVTSPIKTLVDDKIDFNYFTHKNQQYININLPMEQFTLTSHRSPLNVNVSFNQSFEFSDLFFYCRVYSKISGTWHELLTTHSKEIFDSTDPTAQLTILENKVNVVIPQIYITKHLIFNELRVDIFTTKGDISVNLGNYAQENSRYQWKDLDSDNRNEFSAPLGKISSIAVYSTSTITGGGNGESFSDIRDRVVQSRSRRAIPIKNNELEVYLLDRGYELIRSVDNITDRTFLATKKLPSYGEVGTTIQGSIFNVSINEGSMIRNKINNHGSSYTFLPDIFFKQIGSSVSILSQEEEDYVLKLDPVELIIYLDETKLLYNCLHYVLNFQADYLTLVPYMLTDPKLLARQKLAENTGDGYQIISDKINIKYEKDKYILRLSTVANDLVKDLGEDEVLCQISFIPEGDSNSVFMNGEMIGESNGERIFNFDLETLYDINRDHYLALKGFSKSVGEDYDYRVNLNADFIIVFVIDSPSYTAEADETALNNSYLGYHLLSQNASAVTVEHLTFRLGEPMELLLSGSRMSVSGYEFERYEVDIPSVYKENVYKRDDNGLMLFEEDPDTGRKYPIVLHYSGDKVFDDDGNEILKHKKGDVKLIDGEPIISVNRGRLFFLDLMLLNSVYYFASVPEQRLLYQNISNVINDFFKNDLSEINQRLLERTELYYVPKKTIGNILIQVNKNNIIEINSDQKITVVFYVSSLTNKDHRLKENFEEVTNIEIIKWLNGTTLSTGTLICTLIEKIGESLIGVKVTWSGLLMDYDTFVVIDPSDSISIKQELVLNFDNTLEIKDAISYNYIEQGI